MKKKRQTKQPAKGPGIMDIIRQELLKVLDGWGDMTPGSISVKPRRVKQLKGIATLCRQTMPECDGLTREQVESAVTVACMRAGMSGAVEDIIKKKKLSPEKAAKIRKLAQGFPGEVGAE